MIVKLTPASEDRRVWMVSTSSPDHSRAIPVDFMTAPEEQRSFLSPEGGYYEAEPAVDGWDIKRRIDRQPW